MPVCEMEFRTEEYIEDFSEAFDSMEHRRRFGQIEYGLYCNAVAF